MGADGAGGILATICQGTTRAVVGIGELAFKLARSRRGARCNRFEADLCERSTSTAGRCSAPFYGVRPTAPSSSCGRPGCVGAQQACCRGCHRRNSSCLPADPPSLLSTAIAALCVQAIWMTRAHSSRDDDWPAWDSGAGPCPGFRIHTRFTVEALKVISREASANVSLRRRP